jgi:nucleoside-diphosphate-sugar epimerase
LQKNILITGASGFIGSCIVEKAIEKNYHTFAVTRQNSSKQYLQNAAINFLTIDFNQKQHIAQALINFVKENGKIDFIIHAAGVTKSMHTQEFFEVNFTNTKNFVEVLIEENIVPKKFVFISSLASFGCSPNDLPIQEKQIAQPLTAYGLSKLKAEEFLFTQKNFPFCNH